MTDFSFKGCSWSVEGFKNCLPAPVTVTHKEFCSGEEKEIFIGSPCETLPAKRQRVILSFHNHSAILSLQNDNVWYCPIKTTMCDTVVSQRELGILSPQSDNLRYCPVKQKHVILFVQNDNMWYCPVETTTCDTIPSKIQLVILSLQNEIVWYCPFKMTTYDTVCQMTLDSLHSDNVWHCTFKTDNVGYYSFTTKVSLYDCNLRIFKELYVESEFEDQTEVILLCLNSKITRIQLVVSYILYGRYNKIENH
jgi:hypothetical protein